MLRRPGNSWGFGVSLKGNSVVVLTVERALVTPPPHLQSLLDQDSNPQPLDYESDSLTISYANAYATAKMYICLSHNLFICM